MPAIGKGTELSVDHADEPIGRWYLSDGSIVTFKTVATGATRIEGQFDQYGNPIYHIHYTTLMSTRSPDSLKDPQMFSDVK